MRFEKEIPLMIKFSFRSISVLIITVLLLNSCSATKVKTSWQATDLSDVSNIMVFAFASTPAVRASLEDALVVELEAAGLSAKSSISALGIDYNPGDKETSDIVKDISSYADHALVVALIAKNKDTQYVEGQSYFIPRRRFYRRFGFVYTGMYDMVQEPGYYRENTTYEVENNLYRLKDEQLVWSAVTATVNPGSLESGVKGLAATVAKQLKTNLNLKERK
jgi:hypothetical protein